MKRLVIPALAMLVVIALVLVPFLGITEITGDPAIEEWVGALTGLVLVPVWAIWLSRSLEPSRAVDLSRSVDGGTAATG